MKEETIVLEETMIDGLTGLYNKTAFDHELYHKYRSEIKNDLIVVSIDVNGLREINDIYGLIKGDEAIKLTAKCALETLGKYGKIFRVGGDSFIALLDQPCPEKICYKTKTVISDWYGKSNETFSVSIGMVSHAEAPDMPLRKLVRVAYGRMMARKSEYYLKLKKGDTSFFPTS